MSDVALSTIAQAIYADPCDCSFAHVVMELENLLSRMPGPALRTRWEHEDVVLFDMGRTRVVLGWSQDLTDDRLPCLLVSVGPGPGALDLPADPVHALLCSHLIERIQSRYPSEAVVWQQLPLLIEPDVIDALNDALPSLCALTEAWAETNPTPKVAEPIPPSLSAVPANDRPDLPAPLHRELARVRAALYPGWGRQPQETVQMRLAAQAMNATLIVVWMPVGVAAMTYSLLKGERVGFSARMMAVTGTLIGWSQTPYGQQLAAFAGVQ